MKYADWGRDVLDAEIEALRLLRERLGEPFEEAVTLLKGCSGKVVVTGLGKSGHAGRKIAATLASLGVPSFFMHSAEALHGDSGMMGNRDVLLAISNSGETKEVAATAAAAKELGLKIIALTGKEKSSLGKLADVWLDIGVPREADHLNLAPTSSSTVTLGLGDALAVAASRAKGFTSADFAFYHSGGTLGKKSKKASGAKKKRTDKVKVEKQIKRTI